MNKEKKIMTGIDASLIIVGIVLILALTSFFAIEVNGGLSNNGNATVLTYLTVSQVPPEILNVSLNDYSSITLNVNSTKLVSCVGLLRDFDNDSFLQDVTAVLFNSTYGSPDDFNDHYTNNSCIINRTFVSWKGISDTIYTAIANCTFNVEYFANPGSWNCTMWVNNSFGYNVTNSGNGTINQLLGVELPDSINYGTVNSTSVSNEITANVSNAGNVKINLSLSGYGSAVGDGNAMNCSVGNISIKYEKYNLTISNNAVNLAQFEGGNYTNLTSAVAVKQYDLDYRKNDITNNAINSTYWRIYVPLGIAGTCSGNIVFGATAAPGS